MREWGRKVELLPSPPPAQLRMDDPARTTINDDQPPEVWKHEDRQARAAAKLLSIKGAAKDLAATAAAVETTSIPLTEAEIKRQKLLERLAKAKAKSSSTPPLNPDKTQPPPVPEPEITKGRGLRARIQLKLKLESEKKTFRHTCNISKAQSLRQRLLLAKAAREAEETDQTLRRLDIIDRKRELRRRLMVVKMMAAETGSERRARELRERLVARRAALEDGRIGGGGGVAALVRVH